MIQKIREFYKEDRSKNIDKDFLEYEEEFIDSKDLEKIYKAITAPEYLISALDSSFKLSNPFNSIILYITDLTDEFDFKKGRSFLKGGAFPDIDMDWSPRNRHKIFDYYKELYGKDCVAQIGTFGNFRLQSIGKDIFRITEPLEPKRSDYEDLEKFEQDLSNYKKNKQNHWKEFETLDKLIPSNKYGLPPKYEDMVEQSPEIVEKFPEYNQLAKYADGMRKQMGVHAAGVVIADFPISDVIPLWKNNDYEYITQYDKDEVESLGLIKFDELVIDTLDVVSDTINLIKKDLNIEIDLIKDIYENDGNEKAYEVLNKGLLSGIWQMETSPKAKELIMAIKPDCIFHLSDITALNRPGPLDAGLDRAYIRNRLNGVDKDIPEPIAKILIKTYGILVYQEQIMKLCSDLAGFSLQEADKVRKTLGKKKPEELAKYKEKFIEGCVNNHQIDRNYLEKFWEDIVGFGFYSFNQCLSEQTEILTLQGVKSLGNLTVGNDYVYAFDGFKLIPAKILDKIFCGEQDVFEIEFEDGSKLITTENHKFLGIDNKYYTIEEIITNDIDLITIF